MTEVDRGGRSDSRVAVLAVDGGNSKADVALVARDGTILGAVRGPTISHQAVPLSDAQARFCALLAHAAASATMGEVRPDVTVVTTAPSYLFWRCAPPELRVPMEVLRAVRDCAGPTE